MLLKRYSLSYICQYEKEDDRNNSSYHGIFFPCTTLFAVAIHATNGANEERAIQRIGESCFISSLKEFRTPRIVALCLKRYTRISS